MILHANLVLTHYEDDYGTGITSPELPGLNGDVDTVGSSEVDLFNFAVFSGLSPSGSIDIYEENVVEAGGTNYFVRLKRDLNYERRVAIAERLITAILAGDSGRSSLISDKLGDALIVVGLPDEKVHRVTDSFEVGRPTSIATVCDDGLFTLTALHSEDDEDASSPYDVRGEADDMSIRELIARVAPEHADAARLSDRALVTV